MTKFALTSLILFSLCGPALLALLAAPQPADGPRLVIYPPWVDGPALVHRAGGAPVGLRQAPLSLLAFAPNGDMFDHALRKQGAWAVFDGTAVARICGLRPGPTPKGTPI